MKKYLALSLVIGHLSLVVVNAAAPQELQIKIEEKTNELEELNKQVQEAQNKLEETQKQRFSIQREINIIDQSIKQLNLSIKSSEINLEKLKLELESLDYDLEKTENEILLKRGAIAKILREFQQKDSDHLLAILLRNDSLADSIFEVQSLADLNSGLSIEITNLKKIKDVLNATLSRVSRNKNLVELENLNLKNRKAIVEDQKSAKQTLLFRTKSQEQLYQQQLSELEKRQEEIGKEIEELEQQLRANFDPSILPLKRPGVLAYPVANPFVTQQYGPTAFAQRAYKTKSHNGIDFRAPMGTAVFAAERGEVIAVGDNGRLQYGMYVLIRHDNNLTTLYAHLSRQTVQKGAIVNKGDLIGYSGNTGYSTGPHLHFGLYWAPSVMLQSFPRAGLVPVGVTIDPADYL